MASCICAFRGYALGREYNLVVSLIRSRQEIKKVCLSACDDVKSFSGTPESESYCVSEPLLSRCRGLQRTCLYDHARP